MRRLAAWTVAIALPTLVSASRATAISSTIDPIRSVQAQMLPNRSIVDQLVFNTPLSRFRLERGRAKRAQSWLNPSTDGCSAPLIGSSGRSFNFRLACERHDFAYANYSLLSARGIDVEWNEALRASVDDQFQRDMQSLCAVRRKSERLRCDAWTIVFFHTVRIAAGT